jgi:hypothetical protein
MPKFSAKLSNRSADANDASARQADPLHVAANPGQLRKSFCNRIHRMLPSR